MKRLLILGVGALLVASGPASHGRAAEASANKAPKYETSNDAVAGTIKSVGSDTMNNLMALWGESFHTLYPNVHVEVEGKGSATAPPALIQGTATFGPMSRMMKKEEESKFESQFGYKPTAIPTALDTLAVFVHKDNPIKGLSMKQLDAIFSKTRKRGYEKDIATWGDLGLTGKWKDKPISLYGRNAASGTYGYLKEHALGGGDYKSTVKEQPGSSTVVQAVATDEFAIGYSGIGYLTADVRAVPLDADGGTDYVAAEADHAYDGTYPLARYLYLYVNYKPGEKLDPLRREFLKFVLSEQGQKDVLKDGYLPLPAKIAAKSLAKVNITAAK
ncbi:MAG TPA: phosphate ABC transporter substrate-binding protein [Pirellulales bacterium]|nr:phosphate ABC transporter substrate-binding protein [Pirellulales bacterium]